MQNQLQKAISLSRKTGDRLIIFDSTRPDEAFTVMSLPEYEKLVLGNSEVRGLTEDELLDKINRDIAIWKTEQKEEEETEKNTINNSIFPSSSLNSNYLDFQENEEEKIDKNTEIKQKAKSHWKIPSERKKGAEEIIEEDRQYLEEITY